jgi:hypothetical protein
MTLSGDGAQKEQVSKQAAEVLPFGPVDATGAPLDDMATVGFWPRNLEGVSTQATVFELKVVRAGQRVCCGNLIRVDGAGVPLKLTPKHQVPGGPVETLDGPALVSDSAVGYEVENASGQVAYVRPDAASYGVLNFFAFPWPRHPSDFGLLAYPHNLASTVLLPVVSQSGGKVTLAAEGIAPSLGPNKTRRISFVWNGGPTAVMAAEIDVTAILVEDVDGVRAEVLGLHPPEELNPEQFYVHYFGSESVDLSLESAYPNGVPLQSISLHLAPGSREGPFTAILARQRLATTPVGVGTSFSGGPDALAPIVLDGVPGHLAVPPGTRVVRVHGVGIDKSIGV